MSGSEFEPSNEARKASDGTQDATKDRGFIVRLLNDRVHETVSARTSNGPIC